MQDLDRKIPGLMPKQRCRRLNKYYNNKTSIRFLEKEKKWHDRRMKMEEEALTKSGYLGLDFIDVIHRHFADSLDPRPVVPAGIS